MDVNTQTIERFYSAFARLDADTMNACYASDIVFYDPAFELLRNDEPGFMWNMLCGSARDFQLTFQTPVALDESYYTCEWTATYTFSATGRKVVNRVKAHMKMQDGVILEHSDAFSLHQWSTQALGFTGWLFGWNSFFQRRIKNKARRKLYQYILQQRGN